MHFDRTIPYFNLRNNFFWQDLQDKLDYFNLVNQKVCPVFEWIYYCWTHKKSYFPIYLDYLLRENDNKAINMK